MFDVIAGDGLWCVGLCHRVRFLLVDIFDHVMEADGEAEGIAAAAAAGDVDSGGGDGGGRRKRCGGEEVGAMDRD